MIGAGIAWQLVRNPPIVSTLIGVGLYSLLRAPAARPLTSDNLDYVDYAKQRLKQQLTDFSREAAGVAEERTTLRRRQREQLEELTQYDSETAALASSEANARTDGLAASVRRSFHDALDQGEGMATHSREATAMTLREAVHSAGKRGASVVETTTASRAGLLQGVDRIAGAAALGIAIQKRIAP